MLDILTMCRDNAVTGIASNTEQIKHYKLILVGGGGSGTCYFLIGKTTFITRHSSGEYIIHYNPTAGANVHTIVFPTTKGKVRFECWDTAGQEKFGRLRDGYYLGSQCGMILFDLSNRNSYKTVSIWHNEVVHIAGDIPMVVVGNKNDKNSYEKDDARILSLRRIYGILYVEISARLNRDYEKPFLYMCRVMLKYVIIVSRSPVNFTEELALLPPLDEEEAQLEILHYFTTFKM
uniref:TP-binding nuclear protein RAN n=1 Tax=Lotharella vacuolata TaxID=74820 RepID=A0A0H5BL45_9EUKA|nr:TP-binding nuclear protein RAN [Lotharella vacuolata]BAS01601.1 GTP-binding nuclear protein RAN [Lotharella vacuolata]